MEETQRIEEAKKIISIMEDVENKSNGDLSTALKFLEEEFEWTKKMLLTLATHLDVIEEGYNKVADEIEKRKTG